MTYGAIEGGYDTARVAAADAARRQERDAAALRVLAERDAMDIAEILGLVPAPRRSRRAASASPARPPRPCPMCEKDFTPSHSKQETCGKSCGARKAYRTRVAQEAGS